MRTRRAFVAGTVATAAATTGRVGNGEDATDGLDGTGDGGTWGYGSSDGTDGDGDAAGDGSSADPGVAVAVTGIDVPDEAAIGETFGARIALENADDRDGSGRVELYRRTADGWERVAGENLTVVAGGNATVTVRDLNGSVVGRQRFRVGEDGPTAETRIVAAERGFGEEFVSGGLGVVVDDVRFRRSYTWRDGEDERQVEAPRRRQFAWGRVSAENVGDAWASLPDPGEFVFRADGDEYESVDVRRQEERYTGGSVLPETEREGWIAFEVPMEIDEEAGDVTWVSESDAGEIQVTWRREE